MNTKLQVLLPLIEQRLLQDDISAFKIGKTEDEGKRFSGDDYETYEYGSIIAESDDPNLIADAESDLIQHFKSHNDLKRKCENINCGSGGDPDATKLYIVAIGETSRKGMEVLLDKFPLLDNFQACIL